MFHNYRLILAALALATTPIAASTQCGLAGPGFPAPSLLSSSVKLAEAVATFEDLLNDKQLGLRANDTAWTVALFSSKENKTLYQHHYTPPIDVGVPSVTQHSIFRIASVSKVFSVWSFLIEVGDEHFNDPITKYVPELLELRNSTSAEKNGNVDAVVYDDIDHVRWEEVTLGQLASHAAGIPRDPTQSDLASSFGPEQAQAFGLPALEPGEVPVCGSARPCTRSELFSYLLKQHPIFSTAHSPAYSNVAYALLGYAQEAITGTSVETAITDNIFGALGMNSSSFSKTPCSGGVIPGGDPEAVSWDYTFGPTSPSGSIYSSLSDMVKAGQAMLQSSLLSHAQTRRWFRPLMQTSRLGAAVGAPWEIRYLTLPDAERMTQLFSKQGDTGGYHAVLALSPEHELGWVVLTAGTLDSDAPAIREKLMNTFTNVFVPSAEAQAGEEAMKNFAGTYVHKPTNSSVIIEVDTTGQAGLVVKTLMSRGVMAIGPDSPFISIYGAGQSARLYPSDLRTITRKHDDSGNYDSRLGFRATFFNSTEEGMLQDPCLMSWTAPGAPLYGQVALDDWVFELGEDGRAEVVDARIFRLRMERVAQ